MSKAQICPVCLGKGKVIEKQGEYSTRSDQYNICHGCLGYGWVTVQN